MPDMNKKCLLLIFLSGLLVEIASGQADSIISPYAVRDTQDVNIKLFNSDDPFDITLRFDITYYKRKKPDTTYLDAVLTYFDGEKDSVNKNVRIKARGEIRRTICDFPPLFLNFKMKDSVAGDFIGINKLKIVPYCKLGYEEYVLREYLIYKLYNVLTDNSLKVRLFRITFINTAKVSKPLRQFGFAIEPVKLFEKRTGTSEIENVTLNQKYIKPDMMNRCAIFNYMIGNTDWSVSNRHNVILFRQPMSQQANLAMIVPFDFDYAGLVDAEYAVPFETLPIKSVRERLYLGICRTKEEFKDALKEFLDKKEEFYRVINDFPYLNIRSKKEIINYLNEFYDEFNKRDMVIHSLLTECREY
jgi:hypothetical protein